MYKVTTPDWLRKAYKSCIWDIPNDENKVFLTFDDGPTPGVTDKVLNLLKEKNAKATFFCVGKNVAAYPELFNRILDEGHAVGNHSYDHISGWKAPYDIYVENIAKAQALIKSSLLRPPYGRIKSKQIAILRQQFKIIMWSVLSADFDEKQTPEQCLKNVTDNIYIGSIIVCHDSEKAAKNMLAILPEILSLDYTFDRIGY